MSLFDCYTQKRRIYSEIKSKSPMILQDKKHQDESQKVVIHPKKQEKKENYS